MIPFCLFVYLVIGWTISSVIFDFCEEDQMETILGFAVITVVWLPFLICAVIIAILSLPALISPLFKKVIRKRAIRKLNYKERI